MEKPIEVTSGVYQNSLQFDGMDFTLQVKIGEQAIDIIDESSIYAYVQSGTLEVESEFFKTVIREKMYLSLNGPTMLKLSADSKVLLIQIHNFLCMNMIGGPLEEKGRLRYINGCSDTLLIPPSRLGEPCLNLLHFPMNTNQTKHFHPSLRFGIVVDGEGESVSGTTVTPLKAGDCFLIPATVTHKFNTYGSKMNVIAFHPDSDWGPTDEAHPMINRTIL